MNYLDFGFEDVAANREGRLSEAQRRFLLAVLLRETILYSIFALVPLFVLIILFNNPYINPLLLLVLALIALAFVLYVVSLQRSTRADLTARVSVISGQANVRNVGRGLYRLVIGSQSFEITSRAFTAFADGKFYHVYYTPNLKTIVAAEQLEGEPSA